MGGVVDRAQMPDRDMSVDLGRVEIRVPQQRLQYSHVGAGFEHMGGHRMPLVGSDPLVAKVGQQRGGASAESRIPGHELFETARQVDTALGQDNPALDQHSTPEPPE